MNTRPSRRPALRWLAPLVAAVVFAGAGALFSALTNAASADLAPRSTARLLTDVQQAKLRGLSGTVVQNADLGIPALPGLDAGPASATNPATLLSGSHTLRLWYAGPERARVALLGDYGESDLVRNGRSVWLWSSSDKSATHWQLPAGSPEAPPTQHGPLTPQQAADAALKAISPTTKVASNGTAVVAGRPAYLLALEPRSADTLVQSVQIAIDGATRVPTRVQVFAKGRTAPVLEVGFTSFDPHAPAASVFAFNPPPGTKVTEKSLGSLTHRGSHPMAKGHRHDTRSEGPTVVGSGWASVLVLPAPLGEKLSGGTSTVLKQLPKVSGSWGSGRLLRGTVFSAVLTDDGRVAVGAVPPQQLYDALARR